MSARLKSTVVGLFVLTAAWLAFGRGSPRPRLTFLSVGQGDCIVWQDGGVTVLVDVGPKTREGFDAGERIVLPKLRKMGISKINLVIVTHPDSDHIGGLAAIAERFPSAKVLLNSSFQSNPDMSWWLRDARVKPGRIVWMEGRSRLRFADTTMEIAAPDLPVGESDNEGSLFVRIQCGNSAAVLTGDASINTEERMQRELGWRGQVLKAGHHGSRTSTSESFVRSVNPVWAVVSCGRDNRFDHPHRSVLQVFERAGCDVFRTDLQGDIAFEAGNKAFVPLMQSHTRS